jgi:hypothetical protein
MLAQVEMATGGRSSIPDGSQKTKLVSVTELNGGKREQPAYTKFPLLFPLLKQHSGTYMADLLG